MLILLSGKKKSALPNNVSHNKLTRICEFVFVFCRKNEYKTFVANKQVKSQSKTGQKYYENIFNFIEAKIMMVQINQIKILIPLNFVSNY